VSRPGDGASRRAHPVEPMRSRAAEGHGGVPNNANLGPPLHPESESSACSHPLPAREPGELGGAAPSVVDGRQRREGDEPYAAQDASEQSDGAVVPENPAKTWVTPVELGEERAPAKGKSATRNASPTQGGTGALTFLSRIGQKARARKGELFTNLLSHVQVPLLTEAYLRLRRDGATGVDTVTWDEYGQRLHDRLLDLQDRVHRGNYHPPPVRRVYIPKGDGRTRPLGIPTLEDKLLQQAVRMLLEPIYEAEFVGFSYGFRPGRSAHMALDALAYTIEQRKVNWVLDADIRSFFDTIDHGWLRQCIEHRIRDQRLVRLLLKWLKAGVLEDGQRRTAEEGTPQGGVISPLLANIYLHYAFDLWVQAWRKRQARGEVYVVRYADDFVIGLQYEEDAHRLHAALAARLATCGLTLHPEKTRVIRFGRYAREHGTREGLRKPATFDFLGFTHIASLSRHGRFQLKRYTSRKKRQAKLAQLTAEIERRKHSPVPEQHGWLARVLVGYYRYYGVPTNTDVLARFRDAVKRKWHAALQRRSQRSRWTRAKRAAFDVRFPLPRARVYHPWPELRFTTR
jgi:RNA-directed DNA polymerase